MGAAFRQRAMSVLRASGLAIRCYKYGQILCTTSKVDTSCVRGIRKAAQLIQCSIKDSAWPAFFLLAGQQQSFVLSNSGLFECEAC